MTPGLLLQAVAVLVGVLGVVGMAGAVLVSWGEGSPNSPRPRRRVPGPSRSRPVRPGGAR